ncbi:MAG: hypothetical protein LC804_22795 [Acidobacteria bacterium]|nr:hypothetical protein [Acidobacteriota bacterium]
MILFVLVASAHLIATVGLLVYTFGAGMARFDIPAERPWIEAAAAVLLNVLAFPLLPWLSRLPALRLPGLWGYLPLVANSALWALVILVVFRMGRRRAFF